MYFKIWKVDKMKFLAFLFLMIGSIFLAGCQEETPSRDEIPHIKDLIGSFETALKDRNTAAIDSLLSAQILEENLNSSIIIEKIYERTEEDSLYSLGSREFFYIKDRAVVNANVISSSTDSTGPPVEITLMKSGDQWLIKNIEFDKEQLE